MRICVAGPVESDRYFGGVATFTESLADGFLSLGHEVIVVTDYSSKRSTIEGAEIRSVSKSPIRRGLILPVKIVRPIVEFSPDLLITSLEYGLAAPLIKRKKSNKTKIFHFLHAFPAITTGSYAKKILLNSAMKLIAKSADKMIANSALTSAVNCEIYGIRVDEIINVGLGYDMINNLQNCAKKVTGSILYAGRFAKEKNILNLIDSFSFIEDNVGRKIWIAGDGPERSTIEELASKNKSIELLGQLTPARLAPYYEKAEVFVSMNPHEPFGITYLEALYAGCKIVCPMTGGQLDIERRFPESFFLVNPYNPKSIADGIERAFLTNVTPITREQLITQFGYEKLVEKLLFLFNAD